MAYKTGDVARLVGLTPQTLREYENSGLLTADKDSSSGYRYFTASMVSKTIAIRSLRSLGFSLSEVKTVLGNMNYEDYCAHFEDILQRQQVILERQKLICNLAAEQADVISNIHNICHHCNLESDVSFFCLDYLMGETPLLRQKRDFEIMSSWTEAGMFTRNYSPLKNVDPNNPVMGLAVEKSHAALLHLPLEHPVYERHAAQMITMMARHSTYALPGEEETIYIERYASEHHLYFSGEPFMISRFSCWEDALEITYSMLYYPVKPLKVIH